MVLTGRMLALLLSVAVLTAAATWWPAMLGLALVLLVASGLALLADHRLTPTARLLEVKRHHEAKLSLGTKNHVGIAVRNRSRQRLLLTVQDEPPGDLLTAEWPLLALIEANASIVVKYDVTPARRGAYSFGNINLRFPSVLGLFRRQLTFPAGTEIKVYPNLREVEKYDILARKGRLFEMGLRAARLLGSGTEFDRLRDYQPDDDFRRINWKATARRRRPVSTDFETERSQNVVVLIDTGRLMAGRVDALEKLDYVVNAALLLSYVALGKGDRVGLLTFADRMERFLAPQSGRGQFLALLEALYDAQSQPTESNYHAAFEYLARKNRKRSMVIVFTDLVEVEASRQLVDYLGSLLPRHLPICVTISDPHVAKFAGLPLVDTRSVYEKAVARKLVGERQEVLQALTRRGVASLDVPADKLTAAVINRYLELKARTLL